MLRMINVFYTIRCATLYALHLRKTTSIPICYIFHPSSDGSILALKLINLLKPKTDMNQMNHRAMKANSLDSLPNKHVRPDLLVGLCLFGSLNMEGLLVITVLGHSVTAVCIYFSTG